MVAGAGDDASPRPNFDKSPDVRGENRGEVSGFISSVKRTIIKKIITSQVTNINLTTSRKEFIQK